MSISILALQANKAGIGSSNSTAVSTTCSDIALAATAWRQSATMPTTQTHVIHV